MTRSGASSKKCDSGTYRAHTSITKSKSQLFILSRELFLTRLTLDFSQSVHTIQMFSTLWSILATILAIPTFLWITTYALGNLYMYLLGPVDLKKKYNAKWALVTGAGTGIGKSICQTLAAQGLNVVLVSLPDKFLQETTDELKTAFPKQEFRAVAAKFDHKTDYMPDIIKATSDVDIPIVFNNAGYIVTGFFDHTSLDAQLANVECNATATVKVTHHFLKLLLDKKLRGCFVFTSSPSGYIPNPFAVMYGATKAFVSQFAASLAIEVRNNGIDVLAVHPSPVSSHFFEKAHKLETLEMAKSSAVDPSSVPAKMLSCVGRAHLGDLGFLAVVVRIAVAIVPYDFLTGVFAMAAPIMPDYQKHNQNRGKAM
jgi:short-subunit dehydrogenase